MSQRRRRQGSDPHTLPRASCLSGAAHSLTSKSLTGGVLPESENVNGGRLLSTVAKKQLQEAATAKLGSDQESSVIRGLVNPCTEHSGN